VSADDLIEPLAFIPLVLVVSGVGSKAADRCIFYGDAGLAASRSADKGAA
jgi:hypothetical protein